MEGIKYINDLDIEGKRTFVRVDFNVPLDSQGNILDDTRIRAVLPTINLALDKGAKVILASHLGRPKGKRVPNLSMRPIQGRVSRLLEKQVIFVDECVGDKVKGVVSSMRPGDVVLLENLRFYPGEEANDPEFCKGLAEFTDVYINDAFATAHRAHASTYGIVEYVDVCGGGLLLRKEIEYFQKAMDRPVRPLVAIVGGAKVSSKIKILKNLVKRVDKLLIGGGMAFTFLKYLGYDVGKSILEEPMVPVAGEIMREAKERGVKLYLPVDCVVAERLDPSAETKIVPVQDIPKAWMALDIGPATTTLFTEALHDAKTIIWNGPMGAFEVDAFSRGTYAVVTAVANSHALTIVGGGDTDVAVHRAGEFAKISYISTGGGAFMKLLEGDGLPAIEALKECCRRMKEKGV